MTELAARHTSAQREIADTDRIILELIREVILPLSHRPHKHANALLRPKSTDVVSNPDDLRVETQCDFATIGGQVLRDGILDDFEELLLGIDAADREAVEELDHETGETLERAGDADGGGDFDEDVLGGVDVDLELAGFVDRGVEEGEKALGL